MGRFDSAGATHTPAWAIVIICYAKAPVATVFAGRRQIHLLTGHIGERTNRSVALQTDDFLLYHQLTQFLADRGIELLGLSPTDEVPASVQALLGGPMEDRRSVTVSPDLETTYLRVMQKLDARPATSYRRVVFGVDPGAIIGLAALADDRVVIVGEALSPESAAARIVAWHDGLEASSYAIHVGDGEPTVGQAILRELAGISPWAKRSFVAEHHTTPISPVTGSRHADAAILIARRNPLQ